jgi:hypothetical protein
VPMCARIGRALGTMLRQRNNGARARVVVARSLDGAQLGIRDGLVRGVVLAGHHVIDIGACAPEIFQFALLHTQADAGVLATSSEGAVHSLSFFVGGKPLAGEGLAALCAIGDEGAFYAGEGSLEMIDVRGAYQPRAAEPE